MGKLFGGQKPSAAPNTGGGAAGSSKLFTPEQVTKVTKDYSDRGLAKWGQIFQNMGAGGGTGGPDLSSAIGSQAQQMGAALSNLTGASGYGSDGMGNLDQILAGVEPGISPKYAVF